LDNQFAALKEKMQRLRSELTLRKSGEKEGTGRKKIENLHAYNVRLVAEPRI
jgi:hypothetical protein